MQPCLKHGLWPYNNWPTHNKRMITAFKNLRTYIIFMGINSLHSSLNSSRPLQRRKCLDRIIFPFPVELQPTLFILYIKSKWNCTIHTDVFQDLYIGFLQFLVPRFHNKSTWYSKVVTEPDKSQKNQSGGWHFILHLHCGERHIQEDELMIECQPSLQISGLLADFLP